MSPELLKLHIAQLSKTIECSKTNRYSDSRKQNYHDQLVTLLNGIKSVDLNDLDYNKQIEYKKILDFVFLSFEFLDNSILTISPYEIVYCLEKALNEWDSGSQYVIVTTLNNDINGYYFNPRLSLIQADHHIIKANFGIEFPHRFIQISLPKYLVHDYLANVVLYHELGHFIDNKYKISASIVNYEYDKGNIAQENVFKEYNFYSEFFADIFASQYVGKSSNYYLNYVAHKDSDSNSHPSTDRRIAIVNEFLEGKCENQYLKNIVMATEQGIKSLDQLKAFFKRQKD